LWERVPPPAYGGTEAVCHLLVDELVRMGHDVTLVASGDSDTSAKLRSCYPKSLRSAEDVEDKMVYSLEHAAFALQHAGFYDVVHNHAGHEVMAMARLVGHVPMLSTMHCLIPDDTRIIWDNYGGYYNAISHAQRRALPPSSRAKYAGVVHNGIDVATFPFQAQKGDHLLFLARVSPEKGPETAVEVARRTGRKLIIAGKVDPADEDYFHGRIEPLIDGESVCFVGEADGPRKRELYREAASLIVPITWEEPFGLVFAEAQACGTPVLTFDRGAAGEIVRHGETGFVVNTTDEMADAVGRLHEIDPAGCRANVAARFDRKSMAEGYVETYRRIIAAHQSA
jgi:glycosyltransferase involved in cell wall biosynthesis